MSNSINIFTGSISGGPDGTGEVDKDNYRCTIEIPGGGKVNGIPTRVENEPKVGDEVLCIQLPDPFGNDVIYIPLKTLTGESFTGIARQGFKMEFMDQGIQITTQGGGRVLIKDQSIEVNGFSASIKIPGTVTPTGKGPFCGLPNCLFSGAPQSGDEIKGNS